MTHSFLRTDGDPTEPRDPTELAVRLARLYPSAADTIDVLRRAGLEVGDLRRDSDAQTSLRIWKGAVAVADSQNKLHTLLSVAREQYGRRKVASIHESTPNNYLFIAPLAITGVALGITLSIAWMMLTVRMDTWTRMDPMPKDFRDIVIAARNAPEPRINPYDVVWHRESAPLLDRAVIELVWGRGEAPVQLASVQLTVAAPSGEAFSALQRVGERQARVLTPTTAASPATPRAKAFRMTTPKMTGGIPPFLPDAVPATQFLPTPIVTPTAQSDLSGIGLARSEDLR